MPSTNELMRIALGVEYRGTHYHGWETQKTGPTVQAALENALSKIATHPIRTTCAGRTDSGVHAWGQVVHFDSPVLRPDRAWVLGVNTHLPLDVKVAWSQPVNDTFHARFGAVSRSYRYIIYNRRSSPAVLTGLVTPVHRALDAERMAKAATAWVGRHDFSAFRAAACQAHSPVRTLTKFSVSRSGDFIYLDVTANAFLQHMVRNFAGVLIAIGLGDKPIEWAREVLDGRSRERGGVTAPPHGLYLMEVEYPEEFGLPKVSRPGALW